MVRRILEYLFSKEWVEIYYLCANKKLDIIKCRDCDGFILFKKGDCFNEMVNKYFKDA